MPGEDSLFAILPAQENYVVVHLGGEVDEAEVDILEEATELLDFADDFGHPRGSAFEFGMQFDDFLKAHRIDFGVGRGELLDALAQVAGAVLQAANQHFEAWNQRIGLVGAEELWKVMLRQNQPRMVALTPVHD